ncbi:thioesterase family protein [Candidatus Poriferisodalis sp.]|uniref:thioesterase family protein n=1 Tax=Candidatus Poriferisodalis sp. TaxID=3101277 RepID=UPI003B0238DA
MSDELLNPQPTDAVFRAPVEVLGGTVQEGWIDYNGHLNAGYYLVAFDDAIAPWMDFIGLGTAHREVRDITTFSAENHITYVREIGPDEPYVISVQLLGFDRKRIHAFQAMTQTRDAYLVATCEVMSLHIDGPTRRVGPMADEPYRRLGEIWEAHQHLPLPSQVGHVINIRQSAEALRHRDLA